MADRSTARQTGQDGVWVTGDPPARDGLDARLRRDPSPFSVTGSLPVLFFGDLFAAQVATVGLNPSDREYLDTRGRELDGPRRRFETLGSLGAIDRASLSTAQCDRAIQTMRSYFQPGKPIYGWFRSLDRLMRAMGFEYGKGEVVHLDLVQEATRPTWSALKASHRAGARALQSADLPFLGWQLRTFALRAVVCNGRTPLEHVNRLLGGRMLRSGELGLVTWYIGVASVGGRDMGIAGWNKPLARPTGLGREGEKELGEVLAGELGRLALL